MTISFVLILLAVVCFLVATANPPWPRINLVALGLALWALTLLVH